MTANEKAATFIGWEPNQQEHHSKSYAGPRLGRIIPAPDMTKPENLWLLLEALLSRDTAVDFTVSGDAAEGWDNYLRLDLTCVNPKWDFFKHLGTGRDFRAGLVVVAAELYDAEHKQSE